jgi:hypothetical protein
MSYYPSRTINILRQQGSNAVHTFRQTLLKHGKKATGYTSASIRYETSLKGGIATYKVFADESIVYINQGRPKDAKMPPSIFSRKGRRLNLWFGARGIPRNRSTDYLVRRAIKRRGIKAVPVIDEGIEQIEELAKEQLIQAAREDILNIGYLMFLEAIK